jgi:hypothetical protein
MRRADEGGMNNGSAYTKVGAVNVRGDDGDSSTGYPILRYDEC